MKKALLVCIVSCIFFHSCKNNKKQLTILELIDLTEWNAITIATIKDRMQWDTLQYVGDNIPPLVIDDIVINSFEEDIQRILKLREKEIAVMQKQLFLSNEEDIYIHERQGMNHAGHYRYFIVMPNKEGSNYLFTYNTDTHSFSVEKIRYSTDYYKEPNFYFDIEYNTLRHIEITTRITKNKKSQLSYEIIGIVITSD